MLSVCSPVSGIATELAEVPDPVFARGLVGPGIAVTPGSEPHDVVAPIDGAVVKLHAHAFVVADDQGRGVLVHLGIDTVRLDGAGFEILLDGAGERQRVRAGTPMVRWNPADVVARGHSAAVPVVALDAAEGAVTQAATGEVTRGEQLFLWA
ncbi:PTS system glucose-specific IIA component/PTS system N-acetylglucosamine-specific IIA component [Lipingzhangella halophila]|uniref:PTS system glucose-specific IIA component/PTS system N-acetylglucosamine-specific IIA component n=1 Tax=Lipingzhangella halophila TaxID=1783352 RepID=A0A7W7RKV2_9ACTN|nr:PTS system glucose-specific IIA component/PTS system N-acetylglucosamine-specific IIA component [Lipingzhangella halophila]